MDLKYKSELIKAMDYLAKDSRVLFLGQSVAYSGNSIYKTLENISPDRKIEMPVFEDTQLGLSTGLSLMGYVPVSIYPRFNFFLLTMNQLVNHLDKFPILTGGKASPGVIIRTAIGSERPLFPGVQHSGDFTDAILGLGLKNIEVTRLDEPDQILPAYSRALDIISSKSSIIIEFGDYYNEK